MVTYFAHPEEIFLNDDTMGIVTQAIAFLLIIDPVGRPSELLDSNLVDQYVQLYKSSHNDGILFSVGLLLRALCLCGSEVTEKLIARYPIKSALNDIADGLGSWSDIADEVLHLANWR